MKFKGCQFEGEEYFCTVSFMPNESLVFHNLKEKKQEINLNRGNIQIKMNVC